MIYDTLVFYRVLSPTIGNWHLKRLPPIRRNYDAVRVVGSSLSPGARCYDDRLAVGSTPALGTLADVLCLALFSTRQARKKQPERYDCAAPHCGIECQCSHEKGKDYAQNRN